MKQDLSHENMGQNINGIMRDGTIEIKEGRISVKNPSGGGRYARMYPGKTVRAFVNGTEIKDAAEVNEDSAIIVETGSKEPIRKFDIILHDNNLRASVSVIYEDGIKYLLRDKLPANKLTVDAFMAGKIDCPRYTMDDAEEMLKKKGIIYGIIKDRLLTAIAMGTSEPVVIAEGAKPEDGEDDIIEKKYNDDEIELIEVGGKIDFYNISRVSSVEKGQMVAEKISGNDGRPGMDVLGNIISPQKGKRITIKPGRNVEVSPDGNKVFSDITGRPYIRGEIVGVNEMFEVSGDIDISTGNINFPGDIVIKGDISDGMKAKAGGSVILFGNITGGEIEAGRDITVYRNIIGSKISAGAEDFLRFNIIGSMEKLRETLKSVVSAYELLKNTGKLPNNYLDGQIIKLLIDTKFGALNAQLNTLKKIISENIKVLDNETIQLAAGLIKYFVGNGPLLLEGFGDIIQFIYRINNRIDDLKNQLNQPSKITASYIQGSTLTTSGDILVTGKGCYNSDLTCMGSITFDRPGSVVRGGMVSAGGDIKIYELGSSGGAPTTVCTGKDSIITCQNVYHNSVIKIGEMSNRISEPIKMLKAYLYKGELMIERSNMQGGI